MTTQADSPSGLRRSLDSRSTSGGQGQAATIDKITAATPLPDGWASFCSKPDSMNRAHWYATAPWNADAINQARGFNGDQGLLQTVDADTWRGLHAAVADQVAFYEALTEAAGS